MQRGTMGQIRRWCREVAWVRSTLADLLETGFALTDPCVLRLSQRLDRLALEALRTGRTSPRAGRERSA